jgi:endonuclease YncB( thermonuclease family)
MGCGYSFLNEVVGEPQQQQQKQQQGQQQQQQQQQPTSPVTATVYGRESPIYKSLPQGAQKFKVRNVYDGDTLTLVNEDRVRFLGIDTPELKEKQPFAEEAKDYTKTRCHKKEIYLVIDGKDHYGRLLAWIFVPESNGSYLCVNEGLIQQGLAFAYIPNKESKPFNWDKLLQLQTEARSAKRGVWKTFQDETVVATANGSAYHKRSCSHLSHIRNLTELKVSQAADKGLHPCRTCMG